MFLMEVHKKLPFRLNVKEYKKASIVVFYYYFSKNTSNSLMTPNEMENK